MSSAAARLAKEVKRARSLEECHALADGILARIRKDRASSRALRPSVGHNRWADVKRAAAERAAKVGDLRASVLARCGEDCEWCGASLRIGGFELHHILSGPDRRTEERPETCAGICLACHRAWHGPKPRAVMMDAKEWAIRLGFKDALRAINRRLAKMDNSPAAPEPTP